VGAIWEDLGSEPEPRQERPQTAPDGEKSKRSTQTKNKGSVPDELLGPYHEAESRLKAAAEGRGITWQYGKEGRALAELVKAYAKRPAELGPLIETWIGLTSSEDRFFGGKPPTPSMLHSLLAQVEVEHGKRRPRASSSALRICPVCGGQVPQGGQYCPTCRTLTEDFANPEAVAEAKSRREGIA
jgi:hypothetical protein